MNEFQPSRRQTDLAEVVEMLLDKGVVINADIAVSIGDTQLLGIQLRAAIASFETAAKYGLEFPEGTDMRRVAEAAGDPELAERDRPAVPIDPTRGVNVTAEEGEDEAGDEDEGESEGEGEDEGEGEPDGAESEADAGTASDGGSSGVGHLGVRPSSRTSTGTGRNLVHDTTRGDPTEWDPNAETGGSAGSDDEDEGGNAETDRENGHTEGDDGDD